MKLLMSSPNCLFLFPRWFARTLYAWLPRLAFLLLDCLSAYSLLEGSVFVALPTGGFSSGPPVRLSDAGDDLLSVSACAMARSISSSARASAIARLGRQRVSVLKWIRHRLVGHVGPMVAIRHPCRARGPCGRPLRWASPEQQTQFRTAPARIAGPTRRSRGRERCLLRLQRTRPFPQGLSGQRSTGFVADGVLAERE